MRTVGRRQDVKTTRGVRFGLLALVAVVAAGCGDDAGSERAAAQPAGLALVKADTATVSVPLSLSAQLYVEHDTWVYARTTGVVETLLVDLGSGVRAGELLAQLENDDQVIALRQAEVALENAQREVERQRTLAQSRMVSAADSDRAELDYRRADLARAQARRNVELTRVTAPFAGVVAARTVRAGRLVAPGDSLFRVTALAPLRVAVHVPEAAARGLAVGASAYVAGLERTGVRATVIRASPSVDAASGTREFVLELAPGSAMRPGASVIVRVGGERRTVIAVPASAVADSGYVLVWQDGRTTLRAVTLGARLPDGRVEVVSGLAAGERLAPSQP